MDFLSAHLGSGALCLGAVYAVLVSFERRRLAMRLSKAEAKVARVSVEAGALNDDLLQSMQGFVLTVYVAIQHGSCNQEAKRIIDQAFTKAERAVVEGRDRFESLELRPVGKGPAENHPY